MLSKSSSRVARPILAVYYVSLLALLGAAFVPEWRVWGLNWWAYYPLWVPLGLFALGALAPLVVLKAMGAIGEDESGNDRAGRYTVYAVALLVTAAVLFVVLRARTHFLGDGYTLLRLVADNNPLALKRRGIGEALVRRWLADALGGDPYAAARQAFQTVSIAAGILYAAAVLFLSRRLFPAGGRSILLALGLLSGGWVLLFFGYVEYYPLLVLTVTIYALLGVAALRGSVNRWVAVALVVPAVAFHVFGLVLIPGALYLLLSGTPLGSRLSRVGVRTWVALAFVVTAVAATVSLHLYSSSYFLRFAVLHLSDGPFTVNGYTVFSAAHLGDLLNLAVVLVPGLLVLAVGAVRFAPTGWYRQRPHIFLIIMTACCWLPALVFDPKLGMPRDWDLFSFAGIPATVLLLLLVLGAERQRGLARATVLLAVLLGLLILLPRAISQMLPDSALAHFEHYVRLDTVKNRPAINFLLEYYGEETDPETALARTEKWVPYFPQIPLMRQASGLIQQGHYQEAIGLLEQAVDIDPSYWGAWETLAVTHHRLGNPDSALALLDIAHGINPYGCSIYGRKGTVYFETGRLAEAEEMWTRALELDSTLIEPLIGLVYLYREQRQEAAYTEALARVVAHPACPYYCFQELADYLTTYERYAEAATAYHRSLELGLDSGYVHKVLEKYPDLRPHLGAGW